MGIDNAGGIDNKVHPPEGGLVDAAARVVRVTCLGTRVDIEVSPAAASLHPAVLQDWALCLAPLGDPPADLTVRMDPTPRSSTSDDDAGRLRVAVAHDVAGAVMQANAGRLVMFHAGALAHPRTGSTLAFVGRSGMGKSTLIQALGHRYSYVTDETVGVRPDSLDVLPFPKPLLMRPAPGAPFKYAVPPSEVGLRPHTGETLTLAGLVVLDRHTEHVGLDVTALDPLEAVTDVVPQMSYLRAFSRPLHRLAELCEAVGGVHRVTYSEAAQLADFVESVIGDPTE